MSVSKSFSSGYLSRASIDASQHSKIDAELKSLKLLSRRLQATLAAQAAELQILHRLYYKNKNQHHGALFWRNICEVRRYSERLEKFNILKSTNLLRSSFHGPAESASVSKGPWTHCPDAKNLLNYSKKHRTALQLVAKTSEICLNAYRSFHRSMQSGAFLQVLLMFVAIASRMRTLSLELEDIFKNVNLSIIHLQDLALATTPEKAADAPFNDTPPFQHPQDIKGQFIDVPSTEATDLAYLATFDSKPVFEMVKREEIKMSSKGASEPMHLKSRKDSERSAVKSDTLGPPKKKKRKVIRNEIDDIFGF